MSVRFATFDATAKSFEACSLKTMAPKPGEVLIRVACCTICGSDVHSKTGRRKCPSRCVLGHEIIGTLLECNGALPRDFNGETLAIGDRVTWAMAVGCGDCYFCDVGLPQKCEQLFKYGHEKCQEGRVTGGLSSHCLLTANTPLFKIPDSIPDFVASPANCATATVVACMRQARQGLPGESSGALVSGKNILVLGLGMLGLTACAYASDHSAKCVVGIDVSEKRCQLATTLGADQAVLSNGVGEMRPLIETFTEGRGFDLAFDFSGVNSAIETAIDSLRVGGQLILAGSVFPAPPFPLDCERVVRKLMTLTGVHNYTPNDLARAIQFLDSTKFQTALGSLVSSQFRLDDVEKAFAAAESGEHVRVAVIP